MIVRVGRVGAVSTFTRATSFAKSSKPAAVFKAAPAPAPAPAPAAQSHSRVNTPHKENGGCGPEPPRGGAGMVKPYLNPSAGKAWNDCLSARYAATGCQTLDCLNAGGAAAPPSSSPPTSTTPVAAPPLPPVPTPTPTPSSDPSGGGSSSSGGSSSAPVQQGAPSGTTPASAGYSSGIYIGAGVVALAAGIALYFAVRK